MDNARTTVLYSRSYRLRTAIHDTLLSNNHDEPAVSRINTVIQAWKEQLLLIDWKIEYEEKTYTITLHSAYIPTLEVKFMFQEPATNS